MKLSDIKIDRKFAERLPAPPEAQQQALVEDIRARGVIVPLVVTEDGLLLDGHRRYAAATTVGLADVPVRKIDIKGEMSWGKAFAIATNLRRRHLNEAQRVDLASSLLRVEQKNAKDRQLAAGKEGSTKGGRGKKRNPVGNSSPQGLVGNKERDRATERVAKSIGTSRKTLERVEKVKRSDPEVAKRMLDGDISVAGAARKVTAAEIRKRSDKETSQEPGVLQKLTDGVGKFRTIYADPPWEYGNEGGRGGLEGQYATLSPRQLQELDVGALAHPDGCHLWMWTTWPKIRDKIPHAVLEAWGFRWVGEFVWRKPGFGVGRWLRPATEILILAVQGDLKLLSDGKETNAFLEAPKGRHSEKPEEFYPMIEALSPGPYVELFARRPRDGWTRWGNEA